jgi:hypothetical protein
VKADADFVVSNQVNKPQTRAIRERFEKQFQAVFFATHPGLFFLVRLA